MNFTSAMIGVGTGIGNLALGASSAYMSKKESFTNRMFQMQMSNTAIRRRMKDLKAAGLNPILAAGGYDASTPAGSMANIPDLSSAAREATSAKTAEVNYRLNKSNMDLAKEKSKYLKRNPKEAEALAGMALYEEAGIPGIVGTSAKSLFGSTKRWFRRNFKRGPMPISRRTQMIKKSKTPKGMMENLGGKKGSYNNPIVQKKGKVIRWRK